MYAFGLVAAEIATGEKAFVGLAVGQNVYSVIYAHARPDLPPSVPPAYADLVRRCWAGDPGARPTMADVLAEVRSMVRSGSATPATGG